MGNVINMIGGGKPEQEKTVTAGTSVTEVTPDSGKVLSKVTVNPTPSQAKSVTPSALQQIVTPDADKLLNKVTVAGDSALVAGNIKKGIDLFGVNGSFDNSTGLYVWKKDQNDTNHTFIDYVVSDNENAYPDRAVHTDGYYYEKVVEGAKIATGTVSVGKIDNAKTIQHGLGKTPTIIFAVLDGACATYYENKNYGGADSNSASIAFNYINNVNSDSFTAMLGGDSSYMMSGTMKWIAVAE